MKLTLRYLALTLSIIGGIMGLRAESIVAEADSAYNSLAYSKALELYNEACDSIGASSDLYYNIGNTYYRLGDLGHAILWYERALQLDPTNSDAQTNLDFVNSRITDKPVDDRSMISRGYDNITSAAHHNTWSWVAFAMFTLTVAAFVGYLVTNGVKVRKTCFFGGGILLLLTICTLSFAMTGAARSSNHDRAIITSPAAQLSTAPRAAGDADSQAFLLHEGTKVEIIDSVIPADKQAERWYEVKVAGKARAWINGKDMERI